MKTCRTLIPFVLLTSLGLVAQSPNHPPMRASIPFAFSVQDQLLPAGDYLIHSGKTERAIRIVSADGKHTAVVNTVINSANSRSVNSRLVFQKYGNEYFLAEVWCRDDDFGRNPIAEKRQKTLAQIGGPAKTDIVLAYAGH